MLNEEIQNFEVYENLQLFPFEIKNGRYENALCTASLRAVEIYSCDDKVWHVKENIPSLKCAT